MSVDFESYEKSGVIIVVHDRRDGQVYYAKFYSRGDTALFRMDEKRFADELRAAGFEVQRVSG